MSDIDPATPDGRAEVRRIATDGWMIRPHHVLAILDALDKVETDAACADTLLRNAWAERDSFTASLGFGDNVTEPAAQLLDMIEPISYAFADARDHVECPAICGGCGETLAATTCSHCHGSGADATRCELSGAWAECEWCAGVGRIHDGCAQESYGGLRVRAERAEAAIARVQALIAEADAKHCSSGWPFEVDRVRAALEAES